MAAHLIQIDVDTDGNFAYLPSTLRAQGADTIQFQSPKNYAIMFLDGTPIGMMSVNGAPGPHGPVYTVSSDAQGHYHYAVALWDPILSQVSVDAGCPDIIVN